MESSILVPLSPVLSQWVEAQASQQGFGSAGEFINDLLQREHQKELTVLVHGRLTKAMQTLVSEMTPGNWNDIRKAGRARPRRRIPPPSGTVSLSPSNS